MGRWAQRQIRGGGPGPPPSCVAIVTVQQDPINPATVIVTTGAAVTATDWSNTDFAVEGQGPNDVNEITPTSWRIDGGWSPDATGSPWTLITSSGAICSGQAGTVIA